MPDLRNTAIWLLLALAVAGWGAGCAERTRAADARADASSARRDLADYRAAAAESGRLAERAARTQEQTWRARLDGVTQDGRTQIAAANDAADRAGVAERRVRAQLAAYRAAVRAATGATGTAGGSPSAEAALDLLADMLSGSGAALRELGRFADASHAAGTICERAADAVASD